MKKTIKFFVLFVAASFILAACSSPVGGGKGGSGIGSGGSGSGEAILTLYLRSNNRAAWPPDTATQDQLTHVITFTDPNNTATTIRPPQGTTVIEQSVSPGIWKIEIQAYLSGSLYAEGSSEADIRAGQNNTVTIAMHLPGYIPIFNQQDLKAIASNRASRQKNYMLMNDITLDAPIGSDDEPFYGILDGNRKEIRLNFNTDQPYIGLFASIQNEPTLGPDSGTVKNLKLTGSITLDDPIENFTVGSVAGLNSGTIQNVSANVAINIINSDTSWAGGIVGYNYGTIKNCYNRADISAHADMSSYAGGIVGQNDWIVEYCWAEGLVKATYGGGLGSYAGGIAGSNDTSGSISNCVALNSNVQYSGGDARRIAGSGSTGLTSNYGNMDMQRNGVTNSLYWTNNPTSNDGGNIDSTSFTTVTWWNSIWGSVWGSEENTPWQWNTGAGRPKLWFE